MRQLTKEQAIIFYNSEAWSTMSLENIASFQLAQDRLCVPFSLFHESIEKVLNRPVFTHEFANRKRLQQELDGFCKPPSFDDILSMIPQEKLIVVNVDTSQGEKDDITT